MIQQLPVTITGNQPSIWQLDVPLPYFPSLKNNLQTQVCIIGSGIAGLTIAYLLAHEIWM